MTSEARKVSLYNRWGEVLGPEHGETMTELFANLATKDDIRRLEDRFDRMDDRFDRMDDRFHELSKTIMVATVTSLTALTGIFAALLVVFH